jgi:protein-S-isoprenylcysteine O-methyltransferase Ste14
LICPLVLLIPVAAVNSAVVVLGSPAVAMAWFAVSRLAYVLFLSATIRRVDAHPPANAEESDRQFRTFSGRVALLMNNDGTALLAVCLCTIGTIPSVQPPWVFIAVGAFLFVLGVAVKTWATRSLGAHAYLWKDIFFPAESDRPSRRGPYLFMDSPMYTLGYAHAYGLALILMSAHGVAAAAFAHFAILLMNEWVEKPHVRRVFGHKPS